MMSGTRWDPRGARLSIAPMMDRTDRHFRVFLRQITRRTLLYTEMVHVGAVLHGTAERVLGYSPEERPLALQLGGDDPAALAECAAIAEDLGYNEVNLNVGCPSERVQHGRFGACLMAAPERVAACVAAMRARVSLPVTVKHRVGLGWEADYDTLVRFVRVVAPAGCARLSVHARTAILGGLSPKENRQVPPLRPEWVYQLKREHPELCIEINGGIVSLDQAEAHLQHVDAVMIGRAAYDDPFLLADADLRIFGESNAVRSRHDVIESMLPYFDRVQRQGGALRPVARHMQGLFAGQPGARRWRRLLGEVGEEQLIGALRTFNAAPDQGADGARR